MLFFVRRIALAGSGALIASLAFPQPGIAVAMFLGLPLIVFAFRGATLGQSVAIGLVSGFVYYGSVARWVTVYLGIVPWLGLVGAQAILCAAGGPLLAAAWRGVERLNTTRFSGQLYAGFLIGAAWVSREAIAATWPWGGFGWARVSTSQAETPLRYLATLLGISGASWILVATVVLGVLAWQNSVTRKQGIRRVIVISAGLAALLPGPYFLLAYAGHSSIRVEAVQGNSDSALFTTARPGDALTRHLSAMSSTQGEHADLVVWPENAMDINPLQYPQVAAIADDVSRESGGMFLFGTITGSDTKTYNSALLWKDGVGVVDQYDKVHPVPFAEYLPAREFFYPLAPNLFDMVPRDYTLGTRDPVVTVGKAIAGIAICYDIVDDGLFRSMLQHNANVIIAPTNNSDFGHSDESIQQLGIARMRAVETGRAVVNISTVGVSATIAPDGHDLARIEPFQPGVMAVDVPLSTVVTPASVIGFPLEWALIIIGCVPLVTLPFIRHRP